MVLNDLDKEKQEEIGLWSFLLHYRSILTVSVRLLFIYQFKIFPSNLNQAWEQQKECPWVWFSVHKDQRKYMERERTQGTVWQFKNTHRAVDGFTQQHFPTSSNSSAENASNMFQTSISLVIDWPILIWCMGNTAWVQIWITCFTLSGNTIVGEVEGGGGDKGLTWPFLACGFTWKTEHPRVHKQEITVHI